jgi:hypothetical protein
MRTILCSTDSTQAAPTLLFTGVKQHPVTTLLRVNVLNGSSRADALPECTTVPDPCCSSVMQSGIPALPAQRQLAGMVLQQYWHCMHGLFVRRTCWNSCETTDWKRSTTKGLGGGGPWLHVMTGCLLRDDTSVLQARNTLTVSILHYHQHRAALLLKLSPAMLLLPLMQALA